MIRTNVLTGIFHTFDVCNIIAVAACSPLLFPPTATVDVLESDRRTT